MRIFASDMIKNMMGRFGIPEDEPIEQKMISRALESAQTKIEGFNFDSRKQVLAYDDILNKQRQKVYERRHTILFGGHDALDAELEFINNTDEAGGTAKSSLIEIAITKKEELGEDAYYQALQAILLQTIDMLWVEHLELMDYTRQSVGLRSYGQRDPLIEYKREGLRLFKEMEYSYAQAVTQKVQALQIVEAQQGVVQSSEVGTSTANGGDILEQAQRISSTNLGTDDMAREGEKIGRNDRVTITNGTDTKELKFKKAKLLLETGEWRLA
jgi:preprotein translocase subunit SecA